MVMGVIPESAGIMEGEVVIVGPRCVVDSMSVTGVIIGILDRTCFRKNNVVDKRGNMEAVHV